MTDLREALLAALPEADTSRYDGGTFIWGTRAGWNAARDAVIEVLDRVAPDDASTAGPQIDMERLMDALSTVRRHPEWSGMTLRDEADEIARYYEE